MEANENVKMKPSGNRAIDALVEWAAEDVKFKEKFGPDVVKEKHYGKEKYDFYVDVLAKLDKTTDPEEKRWLNMMRGEMKTIKLIAIPNKYLRGIHNAYEFMDGFFKFMVEGVKVLYNETKRIAKVVAEYRAEKKDEALKKYIAKDQEKSKTIERYIKAVRPDLDKNRQQIGGPDRHMRGNKIETERGKDEKVRYDIDDNLPLLPKKNSKAQPVPVTDDALITKKRESTGKGLTI